MTVRNIAALAALGLMARGGIAAAQRRRDTTTTCVGEHWLAPRELRTKEGYTVFMERPSIVAMRGAVFSKAGAFSRKRTNPPTGTGPKPASMRETAGRVDRFGERVPA